MTPDEVRRLDNRYALLFIRGEPPVIDLKYDLKKHPNAAQIVQGGAAPYQHGVVNHAVATVAIQQTRVESPGRKESERSEIGGPQYELLSEEDAAKQYLTEEE